MSEPYDRWTDGQLEAEIIRLKVVRDMTNRMIEDMIDRRISIRRTAALPTPEKDKDDGR